MFNILLIPFINFFILFFFGRWLGFVGTIYVTSFHLFLLLLLVFKTFLLVTTYNLNFFFSLGSWFNIGSFNVEWEFLFDTISVSMFFMISLISSFVHFYSFSYMQKDPYFTRFISYLSLFTFFMFILISASNLLQLFIGWEGVGLASYLLINFWYTRLQANKASIKAMLMNRIGDIGFLIGMAFTAVFFKTLDFSVLSAIFSLEIFNDNWIIFFVLFFFFIGVVGKSAQLGLHTWLPAAMEGPTPVSALIHAATMVTAGVFLLIRLSFLFEKHSLMQLIIITVGLGTALFSALTAVFLYDIKRIIAYSTCSQLGYMVLACGFLHFNTAFFHLLNHAFFKALLFLSAGALIHSFSNEQDMRRISSVFYQSPLLFIFFFIGNIAIMGLPFLSGFYSKDLIIEITFLNSLMSFNLNIFFFCILIATSLTALYSLRMTYFLFFRQHITFKNNILFFSQPLFIFFSLFILALGSLFVGYLSYDFFSFNSFFLPQIVTASSASFFFFENEMLPWFIKLLPFFCNTGLIVGLVCLYYFTNQFHSKIVLKLQLNLINFYSKTIKNFYSFYLSKFNNFFFFIVRWAQTNFFFNELYNFWSFTVFHISFYEIFLLFDKGILEFLGPTGLSAIYLKLVSIFSFFFKQSFFENFIIIFSTIFFLLLFI